MSPERRAGAPLEEYRRRRDPSRTPEPVPATSRGGRSIPEHALSFVVQEHHARRFHHDFRLERDGVLVSWAVPRGVPERDDGRMRLAVHTEDHPLEYAAFEGEIPAGEYGAGTVTIFDHGSYETARFDDHEVKVTLHGERLHGAYVLVHTDGKNWLLKKMAASAEA